jgi:hypothetical protein
MFTIIDALIMCIVIEDYEINLEKFDCGDTCRL